jgi:hypothetical protein
VGGGLNASTSLLPPAMIRVCAVARRKAGRTRSASDERRGLQALKVGAHSQTRRPAWRRNLWEGVRDGVRGRCLCRLADELHDQPNLEKTLARIVESAVAVVGCD